MIDLKATKQKIHAKGFTLPGYARANKLDPAKFPAIFFQNYKMPDDMAAVLRADGLLVETPE